MPLVNLPINTATYKGIDDIAVTLKGSELRDGYIDSEGVLRMRPGSTSFVDLGTGEPVRGLYFWQEKSLLIAVSANKVFKVDKNGTATDLTGATLSELTRPVFDSDGTYVFIADGDVILYTDGTATTAILADVNAPTKVSHIAFLNQYLIANEVGTGRFYWSNSGTPLTWAATNFATAESEPDLLQGLAEIRKELFLLGSRTTEFYYDDGSTPFVANYGKVTSKGTIAPNSLAVINDRPFWLSGDKKVVTSDGAGVVSLSEDYNQAIQDFTTVGDAFGMYVAIDGGDFYVITFPTEDRTFALDLQRNQIYEWSYYSTAAGTYSRWIGNSSAHANTWGKHFIGSKLDGKILQLDNGTYQDNSQTIRLVKKTGHIDHGTMGRKKSNKLIIRVKSGENTSVNPSLLIRWKNDNANIWSPLRTVKLKKVGNTEFIAHLHQLGQYRTRQWEISFAENSGLAIASIQEDVELLNGR